MEDPQLRLIVLAASGGYPEHDPRVLGLNEEICATEVGGVGRSIASDSLVRLRKSAERAYGRERDGDERQESDDRAD